MASLLSADFPGCSMGSRLQLSPIYSTRRFLTFGTTLKSTLLEAELPCLECDLGVNRVLLKKIKLAHVCLCLLRVDSEKDNGQVF